MWSKSKIAGAVLAGTGLILEGSAHSWQREDMVWLGFVLVVVACFILWFGDNK